MKDQLKLFGSGFLLVVLGFIIAFQFVKPSPPKHITIATGSTSGAYYSYAKRYQHYLAEAGIQLEIINTAGSIDNIQRLQNGTVDLAFVQSGTGKTAVADQANNASNANNSAPLVSLASVYYEPLWLFMPSSENPEASPESLADLQGKRIAIGAKGSGTQVVARQLLAVNGVNEENAQLLEYSGSAAADKLLAGELDFVFLSSSIEAPLIQSLLIEPTIVPFNFERAQAYTRRFSFLSATLLPRGVVDLERDIPVNNIGLVSSAATLVASDDIHPALVALLMQIFEKVHGSGGVLEGLGEFPSSLYIDFPLNASAQRFFEHGPPLLQRYLPFWLAVLLNQLKIFLIPLIALMLPLAKILPFLYRWRIRSRIYRWYRDLRELEIEANACQLDEEQQQKLLERLQEMHADLMDESIPLSHHDELYHLRLHIEMVRDGLLKRALV
jgi:TRAP transporter TAXI family solute receptor